MRAAPIPACEVQRLEALYALQLLDTPPRPRFDALVRLTARLLEAPISLVTLVDAQRQWFLAEVGLGVRETSREASFCAHAVHDQAPLVVPDALQHDDFRDNPLVVDAPHIRAYAGVPLVDSQGFHLGTLCVIDRVPREFSASDLETLTDLAQVAQDRLESLRVQRRLQRAQAAAEAATRAHDQLAARLRREGQVPLEAAQRFAVLLEQALEPGTHGPAMDDLKRLRSTLFRIQRSLDAEPLASSAPGPQGDLE